MEHWRRVGCKWILEKTDEVDMSRNTRVGRTLGVADALRCCMTRNSCLVSFQRFQKQDKKLMREVS